MSASVVLKPSTILRRIRAGTMKDKQPGIIKCVKGHLMSGTTESLAFWENGTYVYCATCKRKTLARPEFGDTAIDLRGERKVYPDHID